MSCLLNIFVLFWFFVVCLVGWVVGCLGFFFSTDDYY